MEELDAEKRDLPEKLDIVQRKHDDINNTRKRNVMPICYLSRNQWTFRYYDVILKVS